MDTQDDDNPLPPFPDEDRTLTEPPAEEDAPEDTDAPIKKNSFANFDAKPDEDAPHSRSADHLTEEDFLRPPSVNYVRSQETMINIGDDIGLSNKDMHLKNLNIGISENKSSCKLPFLAP